MIMTQTKERTLWFPEPAEEDDSIARHREGTFSWLSRSTSKKAVGCRRFLNENINQVPLEWRQQLVKDFRTKEWGSVFFELIVARTLQLLGASIEVEVPIAETMKRPDFLVRFPDGAITVEATVPEINARISRQTSNNEEMVQIIEALTPPEWSVAVWRLPSLGPNDSKKNFRRTIEGVFRDLPPNPSPDQERIEVEFNHGELKLTLLPGRKGKRAAGVRGMASGADDTEKKIRAIVARKKKQVRKSKMPVLLAVSTSPFGEREDYDRALFGLTYEHVDHQGRTIETGFDPVGVFGSKRSESPIIAGVLAFTEVGFPGVADPILYLHPRFEGEVPESIKRLEQRTYSQGVGVCVQRAVIKSVCRSLNFVLRYP
jgi:hypothetical protein